MSKETLKLALEALDGIYRYGLDTLSGRSDGPDDRDWQRAGVNEMTKRARFGITALKALAEQPAQQVVDCHATGVCVQSGLRAEQLRAFGTLAQQEPFGFAVMENPIAPPAQRTWVGLTKDEVFAVSNTMPYGDRFDFAEAIEAKLKEKNNG